MKKPNTFQISFLSLLPMTCFALTLPGCMKTDSLGLAGNDDSGAGGGAASGGSTSGEFTTAPPRGGAPSTGGTAAASGGSAGMGFTTAPPRGGTPSTGGMAGADLGSALNPVAWRTSTVSLTADDFWIVADGKRFTGKVAAFDVNSDPGDAIYTTLEVTWMELGCEMRLSIYFNADATDWWSDQIGTYDAQTPIGSWLLYQGPFFKSPIGATYRGDVDLTNEADDPFRGELHFHGLVLSTTLSGGAGIADAGAIDANPACASQPLTQEQATALYRDFVYQDTPTYNPDSVFTVEEFQVPGAWDAMGIQLFSGGYVDEFGYAVYMRPFVTLACKLYPLTKWSATGLLSAVLVGNTLYYTVRAGSGINYTELGRISLSGSGLEVLQGADYASGSNLYLRESAGQIVVELGDGMKFNSWTAQGVFGWLKDDGSTIVAVDSAGQTIPPQGIGSW